MSIGSDDCQYCVHYGYCIANDWPGCRVFQGTSLINDVWDE